MSRSDVDNATPRVTRVEALSRVSPGFPPRAITCAGASTVVPLVHSPLVSPLSDSPSCPVPAARPWSGPGSARSGQRLHSVARHARQVRIGRGPYRKNTLPTSHFVGHHSRFRSPKLKSLLCKCNILTFSESRMPRVPAVPGNELVGSSLFRYLETSYRYPGPRRGNCSLVATPWRRRSLRQPCSCAQFLCRCVTHTLPPWSCSSIPY